MRRTAAHQRAGQLGHRTEVGERSGRERRTTATPGAARVGLRDERELAVGEHRALRCAGRARREHDGDGPLRIVIERRRSSAGNGQRTDRISRVDHDLRVGDGEHGRPLGRGQPDVHPGRDGANARRGDVRDEVFGSLGQHERDDVALADAIARQPGRDLVGQPVELSIRERPSGGRDVGDTVAEPLSRLPGDISEHQVAP